MTEDRHLLAERYALGNLDLDEMVAAQRLVATDPAFAALVGLWNERFDALGADVAPVEPSPTLWDRIAGGLHRLAVSPENTTVQTNVLAWQPFSPGIEQKILFADLVTGARNVLVRMSPGSTVPPHFHDIDEECLVLEGQIDIDGVTVCAGELHIAAANSQHNPIHSSTGALLYIRCGMGAGA